jgi:hypothetical protein
VIEKGLFSFAAQNGLERVIPNAAKVMRPRGELNRRQVLCARLGGLE